VAETWRLEFDGGTWGITGKAGQCLRILEDGGVCLAVVRDVRRAGGSRADVRRALRRALEDAGCELSHFEVI
jgi:hypothetical protein